MLHHCTFIHSGSPDHSGNIHTFIRFYHAPTFLLLILLLFCSSAVHALYKFSAVRIVFFHFESNRILDYYLKFRIESNSICHSQSKDAKFVFFLKCELQLLKFELNLKFVCVLDPEEREINFVHYFLHPACVVDHPSCTTGPASQRVYGYAWL